MADPLDEEYDDIHHALGLQPTNLAHIIDRIQPLQMAPNVLPMAGFRQPTAAPEPAPRSDLPEGYLPEGYRAEPGYTAGHYIYAPNGDIVTWAHNPEYARDAALRHQASPNPPETTPSVSTVSVGDRDIPVPAAPVAPQRSLSDKLEEALRDVLNSPRSAAPARSSVEDVLASPTASGYNALTPAERMDYKSRIFFGASRTPYSALTDHMQNLLGEEAGMRAATHTPSDWIDKYYDSPASGRPSLADSAIAAHLRDNPGASIADVAGVSQPTAAPARTPLEQQTGMTSGPLGDLPKAVRDQITARIGPHMDEREFADKYFGGMYHPDNFSQSSYGGGEISSMGSTLKFSGRLCDPNTGQNIGSIDRTINPDYAYHGYLKVDPGVRGTGAVPAMLSNQIDLYKKMGLSSVQLGANIDVGSYAWAKYGFVPKDEGTWNYLRRDLQRDWQPMRDHVQDSINQDAVQHVDKILADPDPHAIWDLADVPYKAPAGFGRDDNTTIGKALLMNKSWSGKLDLNGADSMARFNDYVKSKMK